MRRNRNSALKMNGVSTSANEPNELKIGIRSDRRGRERDRDGERDR